MTMPFDPSMLATGNIYEMRWKNLPLSSGRTSSSLGAYRGLVCDNVVLNRAGRNYLIRPSLVFEVYDSDGKIIWPPEIKKK